MSDCRVELFIGYMGKSRSEQSLGSIICSCGAGRGLIDVQKRPHWSYGFAVYSNYYTATKAKNILHYHFQKVAISNRTINRNANRNQNRPFTRNSNVNKGKNRYSNTNRNYPKPGHANPITPTQPKKQPSTPPQSISKTNKKSYKTNDNNISRFTATTSSNRRSTPNVYQFLNDCDSDTHTYTQSPSPSSSSSGQSLSTPQRTRNDYSRHSYKSFESYSNVNEEKEKEKEKEIEGYTNSNNNTNNNNNNKWWYFEGDNTLNKYEKCSYILNNKLNNMKIDSSICYEIKNNSYVSRKLSSTTVKQINIHTKKKRYIEYRIVNNNNNNDNNNVNCPGKHGLSPSKPKYNSFYCDGCKIRQLKNIMYGCRICKYNLCLTCFTSNTNTNTTTNTKTEEEEKQNNEFIKKDKKEWYFETNNDLLKYEKCSYNIQQKLSLLNVNKNIKYKIGNWSYTTTKISNEMAIQKNDSTKKTKNVSMEK